VEAVFLHYILYIVALASNSSRMADLRRAMHELGTSVVEALSLRL